MQFLTNLPSGMTRGRPSPTLETCRIETKYEISTFRPEFYEKLVKSYYQIVKKLQKRFERKAAFRYCTSSRLTLENRFS